MDTNVLTELAVRVGEKLRARRWTVVTAESCTGGWVGQALTAIAGSSDYYDRGFITYSNQAKQDMLEVPGEVLARFGAVSEETVRAMASGALKHSRAQASLSISGVAGPGGGSPRNPVGTVCFGWAIRDGGPADSARQCFAGDREAIRRQAVIYSLQGLLERLERSAG